MHDSSSSPPETGPRFVFRTAKQQLLKALPDSDNAVFDPAGLRLAIENRDSTVIWDVAGFRPAAVAAGTLGGGAFSPDGALLVGVGRSRTRPCRTRLGRPHRRACGRVAAATTAVPQAGRPARSVPGAAEPPAPAPVGSGAAPPTPAFELRPAASFSPSGDLVATWGWEGQGAQLWQPRGSRLLAVLRTTSRSNRVPWTFPSRSAPTGRSSRRPTRPTRSRSGTRGPCDGSLASWAARGSCPRSPSTHRGAPRRRELRPRRPLSGTWRTDASSTPLTDTKAGSAGSLSSLTARTSRARRGGTASGGQGRGRPRAPGRGEHSRVCVVQPNRPHARHRGPRRSCPHLVDESRTGDRLAASTDSDSTVLRASSRARRTFGASR